MNRKQRQPKTQFGLPLERYFQVVDSLVRFPKEGENAFQIIRERRKKLGLPYKFCQILVSYEITPELREIFPKLSEFSTIHLIESYNKESGDRCLRGLLR